MSSELAWWPRPPRGAVRYAFLHGLRLGMRKELKKNSKPRPCLYRDLDGERWWFYSDEEEPQGGRYPHSVDDWVEAIKRVIESGNI